MCVIRALSSRVSGSLGAEGVHIVCCHDQFTHVHTSYCLIPECMCVFIQMTLQEEENLDFLASKPNFCARRYVMKTRFTDYIIYSLHLYLLLNYLNCSP